MTRQGDYAIPMLINGQLNDFEYAFDATHAPLALTGPSNIKATRYTPTQR